MSDGQAIQGCGQPRHHEVDAGQFVGGVIKRAVIDVSGDPFIDLAREAAMAFARD